MPFLISLQKCKIINPRLLIKSAVDDFIGTVYIASDITIPLHGIDGTQFLEREERKYDKVGA